MTLYKYLSQRYIYKYKYLSQRYIYKYKYLSPIRYIYKYKYLQPKVHIQIQVPKAEGTCTNTST